MKRHFVVLIAVIVVFLVSIFLWYATKSRKTADSDEKVNVVPSTILKAASFDIYYPDPSSLPAEYSLDRQSFSASDQAVLYSVTYRQQEKITFSIQRRPSDEEIKTFYKNQLPLHNTFQTPAGTAAFGTLNNQTFVSIPTKTDAWVIATAATTTDQSVMENLMRTLTKDK